MKIRKIENKKEIKLENIEDGKYYLINFGVETIENLYYMNIKDLKRALDIDNYEIIEVEREGKKCF